MIEVVRRRVRVRAYSGYMGEETPRSFELDDGEHLVDQVVRRWREPSLDRYFIVRTVGGGSYTLVHVEATGQWHLEARAGD